MGRYDGTMTDWLEDVETIQGCSAAHPDRRGGQHVGTCTDVMVIHTPTGIAVRKGDERSQYTNRQAALEQLRTILNLLYPDEVH